MVLLKVHTIFVANWICHVTSSNNCFDVGKVVGATENKARELILETYFAMTVNKWSLIQVFIDGTNY